MSAGRPERQRTAVVERGMDALARIDDADAIDGREDAVLVRVHRCIHDLERLDQLADVNRAALREDLRILTGYIDRLAPQQLPLMVEVTT